MRLCLLILALGLGCNDTTDPIPDRPANLGLEDITFRTDTGEEVPAQLGRYWLEPANGTSRQSVAFIRLPSTAETPGPPIIYLAGGPGGSGIVTGRGPRFRYFQALRALGDVILYDQRGTGIATPGTACNRQFDTPLDQAFDRSEMVELWAQQVRECMDELRGRGIDLDAYNTERNADDIDELRQALGIEQLVVVGYSYGTHLALTYIRRYGERVARAVLHGVEGPDHTLKLPSAVQDQLEILDSLVEESIRRDELTGFLSTLESLLTDLEASPETVLVDGEQVVFGLFEAQFLVSSAIGDRESLEELPGIVQVLDDAGWGPVGPAVIELKRAIMNMGMSYAMDCASGATAARIEQIEAEVPGTLLGDAINFPFPGICSGVDVPELGDDFRAPILSDVPTLFVSGTLDGRTPPSNAQEVAAGFPNARHLLVENAGHNDLSTSPIVIDPIIDFLQGREDAPAVVTLPGLVFRLSSP